ncbi:hypothetical protein [Frankia sp. Cas4]|uniref:hypothetical protein n=1 Tax=Frankia sp. Cas4 TaxID=3073927 RepID=UPI002AD585D8|nr:hypothetical protein [Frankia sp. Cas4]
MEGRRQETPVFGRKMYVNHPLVLDRPPTKASLPQRLPIPAATRRPPPANLHIRHRDAFASTAGQTTDSESIPPIRLRQGRPKGSKNRPKASKPPHHTIKPLKRTAVTESNLKLQA